MSLKERNNESLLFYQVGDFFELFGKDAEVAAKELDLVITSRDVGFKRENMCGIPHHVLEKYVDRLKSKGHKVSIAERKQ
ncbi:MAG: hypothetical protein FWC11_00295 [Firmicutes bacterium]|nr:hypothetical protein [Bacillota bacterium]